MSAATEERARVVVALREPPAPVLDAELAYPVEGPELRRQAVEGFGEVFRALSLQEIGSSTVQSRAIAGLANRTAVFCMPGSTGACKTAWSGVIKDQLDAEHRPCNFSKVLKGEF